MTASHRSVFLLAWLSLSFVEIRAQVPNTLSHTFLAPPGGKLTHNGAGTSAAAAGNFAAIGAAYESVGAVGAGVVRVVEANTGILLHTLVNPDPVAFGDFGYYLAMDGNYLVVGAYGNQSGADRSGSAYVYDLAGATPTVPIVELHNPSPLANDCFGSAVAISGTRVVVGASIKDTTFSNSGEAYVFDLTSPTPHVPVVTLVNPEPMQSGMFGQAVAIVGNRVVVSASGTDEDGRDTGKFYVFDLAGASPATPTLMVDNPVPEDDDQFGTAMAMAGSILVVGSQYDAVGGYQRGSAYVYDLDGGSPTVPLHTLQKPGPQGQILFGRSVAISGTKILVGAPFDDLIASDSGGAYLYDLASPAPATPVATLTYPNPASSDHHGTAVALAGSAAFVGADGDDTYGSSLGSVFRYDLASANPTVPVGTVNSAGRPPRDYFGQAVAVSGLRVVIGIPEDDTTQDNSGRVEIYDLGRAASTSPMLTLPNRSPGMDEKFGTGVAISGSRVLVGSPFDDTGAIDTGRAYLYDLAGATPTIPLSIPNPTPDIIEVFGTTMAISGTRAVIAAPGDNTGASRAGSVYIYDFAGATPTVPTRTLNNPSPTFGDRYGTAVAIDGTRVVVGVPFDDTGAPDAGIVYVYDLSGATPSVPIFTLPNPAPGNSDRFGDAVSISGNRIVVGADGDDTGASNSGSAYVFDLASATPTLPVLAIPNPTPAVDDLFGWSLAISGQMILVGAYGDSSILPAAGAAYVFDLSSATPAQPAATLNNPRATVADRFGWAVALHGAVAVVGAPYDDSPYAEGGSAFVFAPPGPDSDGDGLLDLWEYARFGTTSGQGASDDSDGDGQEELLELAFDRDPLKPDVAAGPLVVNEGGYLTLTLSKRAGVSYLGESAASPDEADFSALTTTVLVNDATTLKVRDNFPINGGGQRFLKVKVTAAP